MIFQRAKWTLLPCALLIVATRMGADTPITFDVPMDITDIDLCTGEEVHLSGDAEVSMFIDFDANLAHIYGHVTEHLKGMGLSTGVSYSASVSADVQSNADLDPVTNTGEAKILVKAAVIAQGNLPNTSESQLVHVTVNADGTVTSTVNHVNFTCQ